MGTLSSQVPRMMDLQGWSSLIMTIVCLQVTQCCLIQPRPRPPVDGGWSEWEEGTCSVTCGGGIRIDNRECNNPEPKNGGEPCSGNKTQTFECNTNTCPVDGGWSEWEEGTCSVTCGGGIRIDNRECNNPEPKNGGEP